MSENEINEGNCVLSEEDLELVKNALLYYSVFCNDSEGEKFKTQFPQKITKLNEMAKNTNKTGLSDKNDNSIFLDHICRDIDGKLFRVDYHAAAYWANYQYGKWELLGNVTEQCEIITTYEEDYKSKNPIWKPPFKKLTKTIGGKK